MEIKAVFFVSSSRYVVFNDWSHSGSTSCCFQEDSQELRRKTTASRSRAWLARWKLLAKHCWKPSGASSKTRASTNGSAPTLRCSPKGKTNCPTSRRLHTAMCSTIRTSWGEGAKSKQRLTPQAAEIETGFSKSTVSASQHCCATRILCLCHHPFGSFLYR